MKTNEYIETIKANLKAIGVAACVGINRNSHPYGVALYVHPRGKSFWTQAETEAAYGVTSALGLKNHGMDFEDADTAGYCQQQGMNYLTA